MIRPYKYTAGGITTLFEDDYINGCYSRLQQQQQKLKSLAASQPGLEAIHLLIIHVHAERF